MNKTLYLFNPETDLALADGTTTYLPPNRIAKMATDLSLLPHWYASPDCYTSIEQALSAAKPPCSIEVWGWNATLIHRLQKAGLPHHLYPTTSEMEQLRELSRRTTAIHILHQLLPHPFFCGSAVELDNTDAIRSFVASQPDCLLKAPWSGSGKGLRFVHHSLTPAHTAWCNKTIARQRSVIAETFYRKIIDFAMEFHADRQGNIRFAGYSLFTTDNKGAYQESTLATNEYIIKLLSDYISIEILESLKIQLPQLLSEIIGKQYSGYLGVDMMICQFEEPPFYRIHPCVEVNLRMTMGMVARRLSDLYLSLGSIGRFIIAYNSNSEALALQDKHLRYAHPLLRDKDEKIASGYLALTPATSSTHYQAYLLITPKLNY